ncbi:MAG: acyl--CoA ligase [Deltaproteobacteria bacterium]|nr:acyl--CoA ligase [Deltaproteobacteria bacterium]
MGAGYLEGATPYPGEMIRQYVAKGWWLNLTYGDLLDRATRNSPERLAVIDERGSLTYGRLKEKVERFAIALIEMGIKKHDRILIQLPTQLEFLIAYYASHKIGAVPVLAVSRQEHREVSRFFRVFQPVAWIVPAREGGRDFLPLIDKIRPEAEGLRYVIMPEAAKELPGDALSMGRLIHDVKLDHYPEDFLAPFRPDPDDVAVIFPTGGTTGLPKGVPRTHNSFLANIRYTNTGTLPDEVTGLATPIGHTLAHQGPVGKAILFAIPLVLIAIPKATPILQAIERHKITHIVLVPTQLEDILNDPASKRYNLTSLRKVQTAGAALRPETAQSALEFFGSIGAQFLGSEFGSTEGPCAKHVQGESPEVFRTSIGKPMCAGDEWKVIDDEERELPPNTEGELCARGPCIFTGYYQSDAENRAIFTRDGYYKMGDLGKIDEQGHLFVTGRKKDIIQRGGEGIIPSEIESLLQRHPSVEKAAVVGMPDARLGERACAYVVLKPGKSLGFDEMTQFLKGLGAGWLLLPERLEVVSKLPVTLVGKVDKKVLRQEISAKLKKEGQG